MILPVETRISDVRNFLMAIDNTLTYEVVAIQDPFGPTKSDPDMDVITYFVFVMFFYAKFARFASIISLYMSMYIY